MREFKRSLIMLFIVMLASFTMAFATGVNIAKADPSVFTFEEGSYVKLFGEGGMRFRLKMDETTANEIKGNANETLYFYVASAVRMAGVTTGAGAKALYDSGNAWQVTVDKNKIYAGKDGLGELDGYYYANILINANVLGQTNAAYRTTSFIAVACV